MSKNREKKAVARSLRVVGMAVVMVAWPVQKLTASELQVGILTATNMVRQTSSTGTNYFMASVGVGTATPGALLDVNGDLVTSNLVVTGLSSNTDAVVGSGCVVTSKAVGTGAFSQGYECTASAQYAHAQGYRTVASAAAAHAEGSRTIASGLGMLGAPSGSSHAEGHLSVASGGWASHAEGFGTVASGMYGSHAEGYDTEASGSHGAHAEGAGTLAGQYAAHAEGYETRAMGYMSHAEGGWTTATGDYSHAAGRFAAASHDETYVWSGGGADGFTTISSTTNNEYTVHAVNGIRLLGGPVTIECSGDLLMGIYTNRP